jgi:protein-L-isoaspartate(D-aspartate) O-methyltransferase
MSIPPFQTNDKLIDYLWRVGRITKRKVEIVMRKVDRKMYCNCRQLYNNPSGIIMNQTISAPHMHAMALEALSDKLSPGKKVLDIGCGSGYMTACFAILLNVSNTPTSKVVGIDIYRNLVELSKNNIMKDNPKLLSRKDGGDNNNNNVIIKCGNGWLGNSTNGPYDAIHVGASASEIPKDLIKQLALNGKMIIPIGSSYKIIHKKLDSSLMIKEISGVRFVPLILKNNSNKKLYGNQKCIF